MFKKFEASPKKKSIIVEHFCYSYTQSLLIKLKKIELVYISNSSTQVGYYTRSIFKCLTDLNSVFPSQS